MIIKNPEYTFEVAKVSKFETEKGTATRFSITDYDKTSKSKAFVWVMVWADIDLQDGDEVYFDDYTTGVKYVKGKTYATLYCREEDVHISDFVEKESSSSGISKDDLPF